MNVVTLVFLFVNIISQFKTNSIILRFRSNHFMNRWNFQNPLKNLFYYDFCLCC